MPRQTAAQAAAIAERRAKAMKLSLMGWSYERIGREGGLGYNTEAANLAATVGMDVKRALEQRVIERNEQSALIVQRELEKLDLLEAEAWAVLAARHYVVDKGMIVYINTGAAAGTRPTGHGWSSVIELHDDLVMEQVKRAEVMRIAGAGDGHEPLIDDAPVLAAIDRLLKIAERRAKLQGLDAPVKKVVEVQTGAGINEQISELFTRLGIAAGS